MPRMVPPELMLTNKMSGSLGRDGAPSPSSARTATLFCLLTAMFFLTACGPPGPRALLKGERLIQQGQYEKAIQKLQQATLLLPKNPHAWNYLGLAYHANNQPLLAIRAYKQALALDSS